MQKKSMLENKQNLIDLGFSRQEASIYLSLLSGGPSTAKSLSKKLNILPQAAYRTAKNLVNKNIIAQLGKSPSLFQAIPPAIALDSYTKNKQVEIERKKSELIKTLLNTSKNSDTKVDILHSRSEIHRRAETLMKKANNEILFISVGDTAPKELLLASRKAINNGASIKFIVHKFDSENIELLHNLKKNGFEIRHYPDWGFHIYIFDKSITILGVNNPKNPEQRVSLQLENEGFTKSMKEYFFSIWNKAVEV